MCSEEHMSNCASQMQGAGGDPLQGVGLRFPHAWSKAHPGVLYKAKPTAKPKAAPPGPVPDTSSSEEDWGDWTPTGTRTQGSQQATPKASHPDPVPDPSDEENWGDWTPTGRGTAVSFGPTPEGQVSTKAPSPASSSHRPPNTSTRALVLLGPTRWQQPVNPQSGLTHEGHPANPTQRKQFTAFKPTPRSREASPLPPRRPRPDWLP